MLYANMHTIGMHRLELLCSAQKRSLRKQQRMSSIRVLQQFNSRASNASGSLQRC